MGKLFFNFRVEESFLTMTQNAEAIKEKFDKSDHIKNEISCHKISKIKSTDHWKTKRKY